MVDLQEMPTLYYFLCATSFVIGSCMGSFFNVCIYRIPVGLSIVRPPSFCYSCGTFLKWYDNIPIFGWIMLGGRCRYCGAPYSVRYCVIEFITGALFLLAFLVFGCNIVLPFVWAILGFLIIGTFTDIDHFIIPDSINYGGLIVGLLGGAVVGSDWPACRAMHSLMDSVNFIIGVVGDPGPWWTLPGWADGLLCAALGALTGWVLLWGVSVLGRLLFRKEAMGFGDVKLMAFLGTFLGVQGCFEVLGLASVLGAFVSMLGILYHRLFGKDEIVEMTLDPAKLPERLRTEANTVVGIQNVSIPLKTAGQMHYLPFGPYLNIAAAFLLLAYKQVDMFLSWWLDVG